MPSPRQRNRSKVGWNLGEQLVYHVTPPIWGDWFFNRFLAGRFEARRIYQENLRHRWQPTPESTTSAVREAA